MTPHSAVLALAGPIQGDRVPLTNCHWVVEPKRMIARFGIDEVILLNDFEALSLSLPALAGDDLVSIGSGAPLANAAQVVVGPGTGLGAAALIHANGAWLPVPGEGGHIDLAPVSARDFAIWPHIERPHQQTDPFARIEGETLLCGSGLLRLYRAVASANGVAPRFDDPSGITAAAIERSDAVAEEALELFCVHLGRLAGNLALVFMARGGVFLAGGIAAKIAPFLTESGFREAFIDKVPHGALMDSSIPNRRWPASPPMPATPTCSASSPKAAAGTNRRQPAKPLTQPSPASGRGLLAASGGEHPDSVILAKARIHAA
ncbi:MAG: glucokinase [Rhizobiales bacterium]|nr:glucokinase [Hyphomicrobiales bacterium]